MRKEPYSFLAKKHKEEAADFVAEQEMLVNFLNSPVRKNWLKIIGLKKNEIPKLLKIIENYAKLKVMLENKKKAKSRKEIILIEDACLRLMFQSKLFKVDKIKGRLERLHILGNLLKSEYPGSVILDTYKAEKLAVLSGSNNLATDFLVFDPKKNKIIAVELEKH